MKGSNRNFFDFVLRLGRREVRVQIRGAAVVLLAAGLATLMGLSVNLPDLPAF